MVLRGVLKTDFCTHRNEPAYGLSSEVEKTILWTPQDNYKTFSASPEKQQRVTDVSDAIELSKNLADLSLKQKAVILFCEPGDARSEYYEPIFAEFARKGHGRNQFFRCYNSETAAAYGIKFYPSVLIADNAGRTYQVKDLLSVNEEISYLGLSLENRLDKISTKLKSRDDNDRGRALVAYGRTALEIKDPAEIASAAATIRHFFSDRVPQIADTAFFCYRRLCPSLTSTEAKLAAADLPKYFTTLFTFSAVDIFSQLAGKIDRVTAEPGLAGLKNLILMSINDDLSCCALTAYGAHASILTPEDVSQMTPLLKMLFAHPNKDVRWAALYAYGECSHVFSDQETLAAEDYLLNIGINDENAGVRWRSLHIAQKLLPRWNTPTKERMAVLLRELFSNLTQQMDVTELAVEIYVELSPYFTTDELQSGIRVLEELAQDPEYERIRVCGKNALEKLNVQQIR